MAGIVDQTFEARFGDLEAQVRAMRARNPLDDAAVVNPATGGYVAMSSLAFGQLGSDDLGLVELYGAANAGPGGVGWTAVNPSVWVYVTGGRLRVDVAVALSASGNKCSMFYSYAVLGPSAAAGIVGGQAVAPAYARSVEVQHSHTGQDQRAAAGTFGLHSGLGQGWYLVQGRIALSYSGSIDAPYGSAENRRLAVSPY